MSFSDSKLRQFDPKIVLRHPQPTSIRNRARPICWLSSLIPQICEVHSEGDDYDLLRGTGCWFAQDGGLHRR